MEQSANIGRRHEPWNKGKLVGLKSPLKFKDIWAVRIRLQIAGRIRDLGLFDLAIDSKVRAATWSRYGSGTWHTGSVCRTLERLTCHPGKRVKHEGVTVYSSCDRYATEDRAASPVRDHRTDPRRWRVGSSGEVSSRKTFCSQAGFTAHRTYLRLWTDRHCCNTRARLVASSRADSGFFSTSLAPDSRARCTTSPPT